MLIVSCCCACADNPGPFHDKKKLAMMYDAYEYFREHGADIPVTDSWVEAQVTLETPANASSSSSSLPVIKQILGKDEKPDGSGKFKGDAVEKRRIPHLKKLKGYAETAHGKRNDLAKKWVPFDVKDCSPPGTIQK